MNSTSVPMSAVLISATVSIMVSLMRALAKSVVFLRARIRSSEVAMFAIVAIAAIALGTGLAMLPLARTSLPTDLDPSRLPLTIGLAPFGFAPSAFATSARLCVEPGTVDLGDHNTEVQIKVWNCGAGELTWSTITGRSWVQAVSGDDAGMETLLIRVNRSDLPPGTHEAPLVVVSNGGWQEVRVSLTVQEPAPALCLSLSSLDFGTGAESIDFEISNCGGGTLSWSAATGEAWLALSSNSGSGRATVTAMVDREHLSPGLYNGVIAVKAGGDSGAINVSMQIPGPPPLTGQASSIRLVPGSIRAGSRAEIGAEVQNTGKDTGVFHLFTEPGSLCGFREWTATLNPGETAPASITCQVAGNTGAGAYSIPVYIEVSHPGGTFESRELADSLTLYVSAVPPAIVAQPGPGPGRFFPQTGFWVRDNVPYPDNPNLGANFFREYERLGGVAALGYPASRPYLKDGFLYQVFQRGIMQWRPDYSPPQAVLSNPMDWLSDDGKDDRLLVIGVPRHINDEDGAGGDFQRARDIRLSWIADPDIRSAYFANPDPEQIPLAAWDPIALYGLPTSQAQRFGPFLTQRFQRYVLQKWLDAVPGMPPPGRVVGVLAGDLAKQMGLVPAAAVEPEQP